MTFYVGVTAGILLAVVFRAIASSLRRTHRPRLQLETNRWSVLRRRWLLGTISARREPARRLP